MKKRVVSLLLCLIMALSLIPTVAFATEASSQDDGISLTSIRPDDQSYYTYEFYNGSDLISTQIVKKDDVLYQPETPATVEGKVFTGWVDKSGKAFTGFGTVGTIDKDKTIKLYAKIEDGYYVFFMNNDTVIATKTGTTGTEISLNSVSFPVEADQAITGWYTDKELTQSAGESVTIGTSNTYLYAKVENGYWITFDSDGGSYVEPKFFATSANTEAPTDPTKPGYTFAGWYNDNTPYTFGSPLAENIELEAHWTAQNGVKYTVIHWQENANDDGYSFAESVQLTGTPGQLTEDAVDKIYKGFTLREKPEQKTIAGNGSTIVNVYYKRNVYKVTFAQNSNKGNDLLCGKEEHSHTWNDRKLSWGGWKYKGGCYPANSYSQSPICGIEAHNHNNNNYCYGTIYNDLTITAKYGAYIGDKWPTKDGSSTWGVTRWDRWTEKVTYQVNIDTMPLGGATFYGPKTGQGSETAYYYVEVLPGETGTEGNGAYKEHHRDTSPGTGYTVTKEDKYSITGFTYKEGTQNGYSYNNAKFYYTRNSYNIVFISGQEVNTLSKKFEQSIADANHTPTTPPAGKEGYQFVGWYDNKLCEGKAYDFTGKTMPAQNITLYAKWVAPVHTVTLYKTDKTVHQEFKNVLHNSTIDVGNIQNYNAPEGYKFLGWMKEDGTPFNFNTQITRNYNLYAKIGSTATYRVTYDANGGSATMADTAKYAEGATASVMANSFTAPSGKVFLGWSTNKDGPVAYYANSQLKIEKQNVTLYAIWGDKDSTVTLTYNANYEGADPAMSEVPNLKNNALVELAAATLFTRTGYEFTGWNTQADGSGTSFAAGSNARVDILGSGNVLYAQWVRQTGTLTITKTITGLDTAKDISFTVTGPNSYNQSITIPANRFSNTNGNFIGSVPVSNLPVGEYTVTENSATVDGYTLNTTTTNLTNGKVTVNKEGTTVSFINTYVKHTTAKITITKNVNVTGNTQPTTMPTFQFVAKVDGTKVGELSLTPTKGTDGKWTASGVMDITIPATLFVKDTVDVKISEVDGKLNYWTYDKNVKSLQIAKNGTIHNPVIVKSAAEVVPTDSTIASFTFTNEYKYTYTPPTRPSNPIRRQPTTTTKPVQSVKTGDMGIALYAVTSLLSLSGTALLIKKRKDEK